jgi:hypothetical protein
MRPPPWSSVLVALAVTALLQGGEATSRWFDLRPAVAPAPVFQDQTPLQPAGIAGTWREHTEAATPRQLTLTADAARSGTYFLTFSGIDTNFTGRFYQAGDFLLLEMTAVPSAEPAFILLPTTFWWGVSLERSLLTLRPLSLDLADALADGRVKLAHRELHSVRLVTAELAAVRAVLSAPLPAGNGDNLVLHRE